MLGAGVWFSLRRERAGAAGWTQPARTAIAGVLTRYAVQKYQASTLYLGESERRPEPVPELQVTVVTDMPVKSATATAIMPGDRPKRTT